MLFILNLRGKFADMWKR